MRSIFEVEQRCLRLRLARDAEIHCLEGRAWITYEVHRPMRPSPDIHLRPGEGHRLAFDAVVFASSIDRTRCRLRVVAPDSGRGALLRAISRAFAPAWLR